MAGRTLLYLSHKDVETVGVSMTEIIDALERMFRPALESAGLKWVSGYPENPARGLPYISGLIVLNDPDTGLPISVMDCTWITAKRTGAATAVAAKYLARPESSSVGIIACGVQGRSNLEALSCLFKIKSLGLEIEVVDSAERAVRDMDIVVTSGPILKDPRPVIDAGWLEPGGFASPVDFDSYWTGAALAEADKFATDDRAQMIYYRSIGYFRGTPEPYADLGEIVAGQEPGRESPDESTISMNLGLALDDMATAPLVYRRALELGVGTELPL
jgi:ornithine cyclodeaminase/alanine dehydrogenase